ncbi:MAG: hypothetical protein V2A74_06690 [bacterium]
MKKARIIVALVVLVALVIDLYEFFFTDGGIRYYMAEPRLLLWVIAFAVGFGLYIFSFERLSPPMQRRTKLVVVGFLALAVTGFVGWFAYAMLQFWDEIVGWGMIGQNWPILLPGGLAAWLWFEFIKAWKTGTMKTLRGSTPR